MSTSDLKMLELQQGMHNSIFWLRSAKFGLCKKEALPVNVQLLLQEPRVYINVRSAEDKRQTIGSEY